MKKYIFSVLIALLSLPVIAQQQQSQAKSILDKTAEAFRKAGGVKADFTVKVITDGLIEGVEHGTIQLKGEKFVLKTSDIITWFDGKTQWSYVQQNEEVTISNPTAEEIQSVNPYALITSYKTLFNYRYKGAQTRNGRKGQEIVLTPRQKGDIQSITFTVSADYEPIYIGVKLSNGKTQEFNITSYQTHRNLSSSIFRFDAKKYPNAEIIDMR